MALAVYPIDWLVGAPLALTASGVAAVDPLQLPSMPSHTEMVAHRLNGASSAISLCCAPFMRSARALSSGSRPCFSITSDISIAYR